MEFRGEKHRQIFQNYIRRQKYRPSAHHLAAVYLLTDDKLYGNRCAAYFGTAKQTCLPSISAAFSRTHTHCFVPQRNY